MPKRLTVFYSWQSDSPSSLNRSFIEKALIEALTQLHSDATLENALRDTTVELDKDTQGVAGSPPIAQTILQKIEDCAVFVADLSFVGESKNGFKNASGKPRQFPNPNVLIAQKLKEEHRAALDWLNEMANGKVAFFGIEIELWKIDNSVPAPKFSIIAQPNDWANMLKQSMHGELSNTEKWRVEYWTALAESLEGSFQCKSVGPNYWLFIKSPVIGFRCGFDISARDKYIDVFFGAVDEIRKKMLQEIYNTNKGEIIREVGENVQCNDVEGGRFIWVEQNTDPSRPADWPNQHEWLKTTMEKVLRAVMKYLPK